MSAGEFFYLLSVIFAGIFLGATVYGQFQVNLRRLSPWKRLQHSLVHLLVLLGFGGLAVIATRLDSLLLRWFALTGVLASITYGWLENHAWYRGKS